MAASDPTPYVATPTGTLQGVAAFSWDGSAWQPSGRAGPDVATPTGVLQGVAPFSWSGSAWTPVGQAHPGVATPSGVLDGVAVYTWSGSAWTPAGGTATPSTPTGALRGVAAFNWDGAAWQPAAQARASVPTPYGVLDGVAMFNWFGTAWAAAQPPTLDLSFMTGTLDPSLTFTRGSVGTYFDSGGTMQTATGNAARFDYDPITHQPNGLLIEETRTNSVRNGNATGAVPGTPGTMPTNWSMLNTAGGAITPNVIGSGTENGIPYVDLRFVGTPANTALRFATETANGIVAAAGQAWTHSVYMRLVGGTLANIATINVEMLPYDSTQTLLSPIGQITASATPTNASLGSQRTSLTWTTAVSSGTIAAVRSTYVPVITSAGVPIDFTLRIGGVQLEQGAFPTSYIPTTGVAVTRNAEICSAPVGAWHVAQLGTLQVEALKPVSCNKALGIVTLIGGSGKTSINVAGGNTVNLFDTTAVINNSVGAEPLGTPFKAAFAYSNGLQRGTLNGAVPTQLAQATMTAGNNALGVGCDTAALQYNGYIRRVQYWPRVLNNTELQTVTT